jgi:hypothetical protein
MRKFLTIAAGLSLLAAPLASQAAPAQHSQGGSTFRGAAVSHAAPSRFGNGYNGRPSGYHGGYSGYRGGYRGGYYPNYGYGYGYGYGGYALGGLGLGLVAGAAIANSYSSPGYDAPYGYDDGYDYPAYGPSQACGHWVWNAARGNYDWWAGC